MTVRRILIVLIIFCCCSCGPRSGVPDPNENKNLSIDSSSRIELTDSYKNGQTVFQRNCVSCHTSPANKSIRDGFIWDGLFQRLPSPGDRYFISFILDSKALKDNGDAYALKIDQEYSYDYEHRFKDILKEKDIADLILFIETHKHLYY